MSLIGKKKQNVQAGLSEKLSSPVSKECREKA